MVLIAIRENLEDNREFADHPDCNPTLQMSIDFYKRVGYHFPWVGYYAKIGSNYVGSAGFKGRPMHGKVEIAYGTFTEYQNKGIGATICKELVAIALETDPGVRIMARTLPEENYSTSILRKNGFELQGTVWDEDDGNVWEWEYKPTSA